MALEHHKEEFEHWSGDESALAANSQSEESSEETSEELERLLWVSYPTSYFVNMNKPIICNEEYTELFKWSRRY